MRRNLLMFIGVLLLAGFMAACSSDSAPVSTQTTVQTDGSGATQQAVTATAGAASLLIPQGTIFTTSAGIPLTGTLTITITENPFAVPNAPSGANAGAYTIVTIKDSSGAVAAKTALAAIKSATLNNSLEATLTVSGVSATSLPVYSSADGTTWISEGTQATISSGKATFNVTSLTRHYWGVFQFPAQAVKVNGTALGTSGVGVGAGETALQGAKVTILSYDGSGQLKETINTTTITGGGFNATVQALALGGSVSIKIEKQDGDQKFVAYEKTFPYGTSAELSAGLAVEAKLDPVLVKVIDTRTPDFDAAAKAVFGSDVLSLAIVKDAKGAKSVVSNSGVTAAKSSGKTVTWQLDVAKSALKANTTSLTMQAQNYNPAVPEEMTRFPAQYTDTEATGSQEKLISAAFDFIDIKDQDDQPLVITKAAAAKARKSAAVAYAIKKQIPDCKLILKDENPNKVGVQVGFYFMLNGAWNKLGESTLYKDSNPDDTRFFNMNDVASCTSGTLPYAVLTDADINKDLNFDLRWFNFDYVAFGEIKTACVQGSFELQKGTDLSPLGGFGINLNSLKNGNTDVTGFQSAYGNVKSDGTYRLEFTYTADTLGTPTANFSYSDPVSGQYATMQQTLDAPTVAGGCYTVAKKSIVAPECSVSGKVLKADNSAAADRAVQIYDRYTYGGARWIYTNNAGQYESQVYCNNDYSISVDGITRNFKVDGILVDPENSDASNVVTMKDIVKSNQAPTAYLGVGTSSVMTGGRVSLNGYGYDPDGDTLTFAWSTTCGTLSATSGQNLVWTAPATANSCTISLTANDGSLTSTPATTSVFVSADGNRPPVITNMFAPGSATSGSQSGLSVSAFDYNSADTLSYNWSATCGTFQSGTTATPTWTAPSVTGNSSQSCSITVIVSDNATSPLSVSRSATVNVLPNRPPSIFGVNVPTSAGLGTSVNLLASASDPDGGSMTWAWSVVSGGGTLGAGCSGSGTQVSSSCVYNAPATEATVTVRFTVNDGVNSAVAIDRTINVSNASGSVDVVIQ